MQGLYYISFYISLRFPKCRFSKRYNANIYKKQFKTKVNRYFFYLIDIFFNKISNLNTFQQPSVS